MKPITFLCIVIYVFAYMQIEIKAFSSPQNCIDDINKLVKEKRRELSTDDLLMNYHTKRALTDICSDYVPHKVHKVLTLIDKDACSTEIPTTKEFEESIYEAYVDLLERLKNYKGGDVPNSFSQLTDRRIIETNAIFRMALMRLAGICLHKNAEEI